MAGSRILQIERGPIENRATERDLEDAIIGKIGDYIDLDIDVNDSIEWFLSSLLDSAKPDKFIYNEKDKTIIFKDGFKDAFFEDIYKQFKSITKKITKDVFTGKNSKSDSMLYELKNTISPSFGFRIWNMYQMDLYEFVRGIEEEEIYHIGTVARYHY